MVWVYSQKRKEEATRIRKLLGKRVRYDLCSLVWRSLIGAIGDFLIIAAPSRDILSHTLYKLSSAGDLRNPTFHHQLCFMKIPLSSLTSISPIF